jgi:hypothetical protein
MSWKRMKRGAGAAVLLALGACNQEGSLFETERTSGQAGGGTNTLVVVGNWETTLIFTVEDDIQTVTTRWEFNAAGLTCRFNQVVESLLEGFPRFETRPCTWATANGVLTVTFTDNGEVLPMRYDFAAFDPNRLVLDDIEYHRVPDAGGV